MLGQKSSAYKNHNQEKKTKHCSMAVGFETVFTLNNFGNVTQDPPE